MIGLYIEGTAEDRTIAMLSAFRSAPEDEDIAVASGPAYSGDAKFAAVVVSISNKHHGFTATEARYAAFIAEHVAIEFPGINVDAFQKLAGTLRDAADLAERDLHGFDS